MHEFLDTPGLHTVTLKILYNSFVTSKTLDIYTFPQDNFSVSHCYIDTGISSRIISSLSGYNITINGQKGDSYTYEGTSAGIYNIPFSLSSGNYTYSGTAASINVCNKPEATNIYYSRYSYCSFDNLSNFYIHMNETGGDLYSKTSGYPNWQPLNYSIYLNGTYYTTVSNSGHL